MISVHNERMYYKQDLLSKRSEVIINTINPLVAYTTTRDKSLESLNNKFTT